MKAAPPKLVPSAPTPPSRAKPAISAAQHELRGRALTAEGKYDEAVAELTEAIRLQPDLARAYNARGYAYLLARDFQHALADFDQALRLNPGYANAIQNRETTLSRMKTARH